MFNTYLKYGKMAYYRFRRKENPSVKNIVNIESYPLLNIGDTLGPIIVEWLLNKKGIDKLKKVKHTTHLLTVGSVLGFGAFDATVWGSGILNTNVIKRLKRHRFLLHRKLDIRAVRGPLTREVLLAAGYQCPEMYGDPAVLMPLIYNTEHITKLHDISVILHYRTNLQEMNHSNTLHNKYTINIDPYLIKENNINFIDPKTCDYNFFINEILSSKLIISSSLHGIILSEAYGIPAIFLNRGMNDQQTKFKDWYFSTNRGVSYCTTIEEALKFNIPIVPNLDNMRNNLLNSFPYDLWEE